ncbi:antitoxin Xre/MbcA/ParS toxin-binding domain-containing protein [Roseateles asaccharophilus]|uniref:antitoxin Xre/MbcA/ParS toxin-binding domain-containing protein n=1 Tax=Roseateles asaccharophilus TaxID=582607 RepID=UPI00286ADF48|nr:antitoxin Xre/MbcA/ParS toxin-binding domain-containing protein [Roseateles asaccharophilus]
MNSTAEQFIATQRALLDRLQRFVPTEAYRRLRSAAGDVDAELSEAWLLEWLVSPALGLGARPIDVANKPAGIDLVEEHLRRIAQNTGG